jgi:hypothetical protein
MYDSYISRNDIDDYDLQAAGGIISASLLAVPGASGYYKGGLTVRSHGTTSNSIHDRFFLVYFIFNVVERGE